MEKSIIVKNLPKNVYVAELCDSFRCFGNIVSATIHSDENTRSGDAYIEFEDTFSALNAVKQMNDTKLGRKLLQVSLCSEKEHFTKVFVKNFSLQWDVCDLLRVFESVGTVENVNISETKGKSNGFGYVSFTNHYTAKRAIEHINGKEIEGHKLVVERFQSKTEREALKKNSLEYVEQLLEKSIQLNNLYVKNLPSNMEEEDLEKLFGNFGSIKSVKIAVDESGVSRGFGFVCYESKQDAKKALDKMNGYPIRGKRLQISFKEDGQIRKQYYDLKKKEKDIKIKQYKQRSMSMPKLLPHSVVLSQARR